MSPRTEKQFEEIREGKKALILDTALELFASEGFYPTSIGKIAKRAGISKGLMYNYFESKEELIQEIMKKGLNEMIETFDPDKDGVLTDNEFVFMVEEIFRLLKDNTRYWKLYFAVMMQPPVFKLIKDEINELVPKFLKIQLDYYKKKGVKNPLAETMLFGAVMDGVALNYAMNPENFPIDAIKKMIIEKFSYINNKV